MTKTISMSIWKIVLKNWFGNGDILRWLSVDPVDHRIKKLFSNLYFSDIIERYGVWRSLVARSAGGREVAGSNPVTPISWLKTYVSQIAAERMFEPRNKILLSVHLPFQLLSSFLLRK